ncbi:hypothetical protein GYMLUDRAFT_251949 [Collybiopsis luxurians FD-317 M1]|uniref:Uncharacterized protein n=1 Tax=Collybiopsis luxurians FD-317 M1 TaxID=944289 RepID=A0A0D0BB66_9AGAR|nr:hypothetical protein GYMLUDRAFT_251949 [Collybiopsis luxurians FD-317 M1]
MASPFSPIALGEHEKCVLLKNVTGAGANVSVESNGNELDDTRETGADDAVGVSTSKLPLRSDEEEKNEDKGEGGGNEAWTRDVRMRESGGGDDGEEAEREGAGGEDDKSKAEAKAYPRQKWRTSSLSRMRTGMCGLRQFRE